MQNRTKPEQQDDGTDETESPEDTITKLKDERRALEEKLNDSEKLASLGRMAGEIAHEINNPLAIIMGRVDQLEMLDDEGELHTETLLNTTRKIRETVKRITEIIRGLKEFAREQTDDDFCRISAKVLVDDVKSLCQERFKNSGVRLEANLEDPKQPLECNKVRMSQVVLNLMNNSFDAIRNDEDPWIEIHIYAESDHNCIEVIDSGDGIPSSIADKLMRPYFTTKADSGGMGLGLSISRDIMAGHSGTLQIVPGREHTTLLLRFPKKLIQDTKK